MSPHFYFSVLLFFSLQKTKSKYSLFNNSTYAFPFEQNIISKFFASYNECATSTATYTSTIQKKSFYLCMIIFMILKGKLYKFLYVYKVIQVISHSNKLTDIYSISNLHMLYFFCFLSTKRSIHILPWTHKIIKCGFLFLYLCSFFSLFFLEKRVHISFAPIPSLSEKENIWKVYTYYTCIWADKTG